MSPSRRASLVIISIATGVIIALLMLEAGLRLRDLYIRRSESMPPGFILYDTQLGWKLASGWQGEHRHFDYRATYRVDDRGFRAGTQATGAARRWAVLGDSYTFGLGVNDNETFVAQLNRVRAEDHFINFAVPGYSTDQQWLLVHGQPALQGHDRYLLVVYLGNDLLDNLLPFPLQALYAKPYMELRHGELVLQNVPVPRLSKPAARHTGDLARLRSAGGHAVSVGRRLLQYSRLGQSLADYLFPIRPAAGELATGLQPEIRVFEALLDRIAAITGRQRLTVVLMPGRSLARQMNTYPAAMQAFFRDEIRRLSARAQIRVVDLSAGLQDDGEQHQPRLFYPVDGHLTAAGHARTAEILLQALF